MTTVVVYGQKPEKTARLAAAVLCQYGTVRLFMQNSLVTAGVPAGMSTDGFSVVATDRLERLMLPRTVLLLADQSAPRRLEMSDDVIVAACADNRRMTRLMNGRANPVVTCGTGVRDTLTLSSATGERAILCIQRSLPTVGGEWLEPFEFSVRINGCDMRSALLAAGAAAVCGCRLQDCTTDIAPLSTV